jgi:hypothetical protein
MFSTPIAEVKPQNTVTRQQIRLAARVFGCQWMKENYGGEPRSVRRKLGLARAKFIAKAEMKRRGFKSVFPAAETKTFSDLPLYAISGLVTEIPASEVPPGAQPIQGEQNNEKLHS